MALIFPSQAGLAFVNLDALALKIWGGTLPQAADSGMLGLSDNMSVILCEGPARFHETREDRYSVARLSDEEFRTWCQRNQLAPETVTSIQRIRTSPPARRPHSRASNVSGHYPSVIMGCVIQFESQHVELWTIYMYLGLYRRTVG